MKIKADFKGLENFSKSIDNMQKDLKSLNGKLPISDILNDRFMRTHTSFNSIDEFFLSSGFSVESQEDLVHVDESKLDLFVAQNSKFQTWSDMLEKAGSEYAANKLFK